MSLTLDSNKYIKGLREYNCLSFSECKRSKEMFLWNLFIFINETKKSVLFGQNIYELNSLSI